MTPASLDDAATNTYHFVTCVLNICHCCAPYGIVFPFPCIHARSRVMLLSFQWYMFVQSVLERPARSREIHRKSLWDLSFFIITE